MWTGYRINTDKSEKMNSQEDNCSYVVIIFFVNSFNAVYAFTEL